MENCKSALGQNLSGISRTGKEKWWEGGPRGQNSHTLTGFRGQWGGLFDSQAPQNPFANNPINELLMFHARNHENQGSHENHETKC